MCYSFTLEPLPRKVENFIQRRDQTTQRTNTTNEKPIQRLAFPIYDEEDILNLDAVIAVPPPHQSGTIRVKLTYKEPNKSIPVENSWEE